MRTAYALLAVVLMVPFAALATGQDKPQIPERSGLPAAVRGAGAVRFGFPSLVIGTPAVG